MGERLRLLKWSAMNSRLPKRMVSLREKILHDGCSSLAAMVSTIDGTIGTYRGKERYQSSYLACQLSVFFASAKIGWSRSCILVLRWSCELPSTLLSILVQASPWM
jgi:hypothetical protein